MDHTRDSCWKSNLNGTSRIAVTGVAKPSPKSLSDLRAHKSAPRPGRTGRWLPRVLIGARCARVHADRGVKRAGAGLRGDGYALRGVVLLHVPRRVGWFEVQQGMQVFIEGLPPIPRSQRSGTHMRRMPHGAPASARGLQPATTLAGRGQLPHVHRARAQGSRTRAARRRGAYPVAGPQLQLVLSHAVAHRHKPSPACPPPAPPTSPSLVPKVSSAHELDFSSVRGPGVAVPRTRPARRRKIQR